MRVVNRTPPDVAASPEWGLTEEGRLGVRVQLEVQDLMRVVWILVDRGSLCQCQWLKWEVAVERDCRCQTWDEKNNMLLYALRVLHYGPAWRWRIGYDVEDKIMNSVIAHI